MTDATTDKPMTDAEKWAFWVENVRETLEIYESLIEADPSDPDGLAELRDSAFAQIRRVDGGEDPATVFASDKTALEAVLA